MVGGILGICPCLRRPAAVDGNAKIEDPVCASLPLRIDFFELSQHQSRIKTCKSDNSGFLKLAPLIWDQPENVILTFLTAQVVDFYRFQKE